MTENMTFNQRRLLLIKVMGDLDEAKRRLKARIPGAAGEAKRRLKSEIEELQQQREEARVELAEVNQAIRAGKAVQHRGGLEISVSQMFVELARRHLEKDDFNYLYQQALTVTESANDQ